MPGDSFEETFVRGASEGEIKTSYRVILDNWEPRIVAALSGEKRLHNLIEQGSNFFERVVVLCLRKPAQSLDAEEAQLGEVLVRAGNFGLGKRVIASETGRSCIEAQNLLNQYYAIFPGVRRWLKETGRLEAHAQVWQTTSKILESSVSRCTRVLPEGWTYSPPLTFEVPSYIYEIQVEKFLRHFFEQEPEIAGEIVRLPISVAYHKVPEAPLQ